MHADVDEAVLGTAFLVSPYASFVLDWDGNILVCNRRAERLYHAGGAEHPDAMRGMAFAALTDHSQEEMTHLLRGGAAKGMLSIKMTGGAHLQTTLGTVFRVSLLRSATRGERLYLLTQDQLKSTAEALTKMNARRKEARDNLVRLETAHFELHQSLATMEAFAHAASHDLRTPLNTMSGLLELFSQKFTTDLPETAVEYLSYMSRAVEQMKGLTEDLLEHAKSTSSVVTAQPVSLREIVETTRDDMELALAECGASVSVEGEDFTIMAEPLLMQILVTNLLSNAVKFAHPDRRPDIVVTLGRGEATGGWLVVRDNGIGFPPERADDILKPFVRVSDDTPGSGIGLSTCAEVCRRHGWRIEAHSNGDDGAEFRISF